MTLQMLCDIGEQKLLYLLFLKVNFYKIKADNPISLALLA